MPPGSRRRVKIGSRHVAVFNVNGDFFALRDVCPHQGAALSAGQLVHCVHARKPGCYEWDPSTPFVRCPWHGWEYDLTTGQSWSGPSRVRTFPVSVESGGTLEKNSTGRPARVPGPFVAETVEVSVEDDYVVIHDERRGAG
jgi:3-phenylpropionate/trans-cinnamate dioxygenase ferredoxin subunit